MRFHGPGQEQRAFHPQVCHTVLHNVQLNSNNTGHFDGAAEGDFAVTLGEVEVADAEFGAFDVNGEVNFAAAAEVLNVAVPAMLGATGDGSCTFLTHLVFDIACSAACVYVLRLGGLGDNFFEFLRGVGADELAFAAVPFGQDFGGWGAAEDTGVDEAGEADVGDMAGGCKDTFEIPDGFGTAKVSSCQSHIRRVSFEATGHRCYGMVLWINQGLWPTH